MEKFRSSWGGFALLIVGGIVTAAWWYETPSGAASAPRALSSATAIHPSASQVQTQGASTAGPAERRLDLAALRKSLAGRPDAEAEVQRILAFARFEDQVASYGENRKNMSDADKRILAQQILGELPEHVARNEIVPVQAEAMSAALLMDAEPDAATRDAAIQNMQQQWNTYAQQTVGPSPAQDPRYQTYSQQARQIVDQVQTSVRDPDQQQTIISQRLQTLRTQIYDGAPSAGTN
ncbi:MULTISPECIES: phospholipase C accessory protein PlcR [Paraburkholderia]|uniref:phospholipase C accessory protein PlcR n=1 Tax=Paraburkholderia TaxID=1822464 RepID=UPI002251DE6F|nr:MULTISPECIES: phospholipase C accessory protein PlcR [Paraburkholderia]MCX4160913.1 phospholipase C accessory protein PlcR [Paraburkholderia megapolitana]MDN7156409.1 phospholipase C accessory protein PlcR [Paraburkholderia sp. CHISQ3]MDQ6493454.1 phospholipase C accessory protein PlcR [Paraburkholderia megapolitana]